MVRRIIKYFFLESAYPVQFIIWNLYRKTFCLEIQNIFLALLFDRVNVLPFCLYIAWNNDAFGHRSLLPDHPADQTIHQEAVLLRIAMKNCPTFNFLQSTSRMVKTQIWGDLGSTPTLPWTPCVTFVNHLCPSPLKTCWIHEREHLLWPQLPPLLTSKLANSKPFGVRTGSAWCSLGALTICSACTPFPPTCTCRWFPGS